MMTMMMIDMFQRWKVLLKPRGVFFPDSRAVVTNERNRDFGTWSLFIMIPSCKMYIFRSDRINTLTLLLSLETQTRIFHLPQSEHNITQSEHNTFL